MIAPANPNPQIRLLEACAALNANQVKELVRQGAYDPQVSLEVGQEIPGFPGHHYGTPTPLMITAMGLFDAMNALADMPPFEQLQNDFQKLPEVMRASYGDSVHLFAETKPQHPRYRDYLPADLQSPQEMRLVRDVYEASRQAFVDDVQKAQSIIGHLRANGAEIDREIAEAQHAGAEFKGIKAALEFVKDYDGQSLDDIAKATGINIPTPGKREPDSPG